MEDGGQRREARGERAEDGGQKSEVRFPCVSESPRELGSAVDSMIGRSDVGSQKSDGRDQKSEVRSRRAEVGGRRARVETRVRGRNRDSALQVKAVSTPWTAVACHHSQALSGIPVRQAQGLRVIPLSLSIRNSRGERRAAFPIRKGGEPIRQAQGLRRELGIRRAVRSEVGG